MTNRSYYSTFETSLGPFSIAVDETGSVLATAFGRAVELQQRLNPGSLVKDEGRTDHARTQIWEYLEGERTSFDLALAAHGSDFQHRVWKALRDIPRGETRSYGALASELHSSARAVGRANATNPICLIVPCHRVIGADGSLTGFAFGEQIKERLLNLEGASGFHATLLA